MKESPLVLILSLATLCLLIAAACSQKSANDNSSVTTTPVGAATPKPKPKRPAPDFTVSAPDLFKETRADKDFKVSEKYGGKQIAVNGRVRTVTTSQTPMLVFLAAGGITEYVNGEFDDEEKESVVALKEGQNITMQCLGGNIWGTFPALKHCTVVSVE